MCGIAQRLASRIDPDNEVKPERSGNLRGLDDRKAWHLAAFDPAQSSARDLRAFRDDPLALTQRQALVAKLLPNGSN
jgi:hypothetical protein